MTIKHGGNLLQIADQYGIDVTEWLDLSTGVSPFTFPVATIPDSVWNQLPQINDGLESAAKHYYRAAKEPVAIAGSQAGIMILPDIITELRGGVAGVVALPRVGYKEHQHAWLQVKSANNLAWEVIWYDRLPSHEQVERCDVVVVINPNNPTGHKASVDKLLSLHQQLAKKDGILVVDEAFVDTEPSSSILTKFDTLDHLVVFRSVGKFFGLAGARVGFLFANQVISDQVYARIGPWTVTGPSRWVMKQALADTAWQQQTTERLKTASSRLNQLLNKHLNYFISSTDLFCTVYMDNAEWGHDLLCKKAIFTRLCDEHNALRFGLPANEKQWKKLENALIALKQEIEASR